MKLFDPQGRRLYLTAEEREAFIEVANNAEREVRTFCLVLAYTGCRISEALALTPRSFDFSGRAIVFETLKKRRAGIYRAIPMPQDTLDTIDMVHGLQEGGKRKRKGRAEIPLWPWSRTTAFRRIKEVMDAAGIADGPHKCPKGLRHGYGVYAIGCGVPLNSRPACTAGQVYPELLRALCTLLDHALEGRVDSGCWYGTFYRWFREDLALWESERTTQHHLGAFGGMGSFNDLVPTIGFPGGRAGFERFDGAYRLLKELSYTCAALWDEALRRYPDQRDRDVLIDYRGVPVTICTCSEGHRWMKEDFAMSFYAAHAKTIAEMNAGFALVAKLGGEAAVHWLFRHKLPFDPEPVLDAMQAAVAHHGLEPKPDDCKACRKRKIDCEILYLTGWPMALSREFFRVESATL